MQTIRDRLIHMLRRSFGDAAGDAAAAGKCVLTENLDSLDRLEFVAEIENTFGIEIPPAVTVDMQTIEDIAKYVEIVTRDPAHGAH